MTCSDQAQAAAQVVGACALASVRLRALISDQRALAVRFTGSGGAIDTPTKVPAFVIA